MTEPGAMGASSRILILAPHPDDEALAVGGLLQRAIRMRAEIHLLFVTDGENNPWAQRATERRWRIAAADQERWRTRRRSEALASLASLGVPASRATFLAFPDQGLTEMLMRGGGELLAALRRTMERVRPTLLIAPDAYDLHPDHSALAVIASLARATMDPRIPHPRALAFIVHSRRPRPRAELALRLTVEEHRRKRAAILCHGSQLLCRRRTLLAHGDEPEEFIVTAPHAAQRGLHPVRPAMAEGGPLVLHISPRARLGAWGAIELRMIAVEDGAARAFALRMPRRGDLAEIVAWRDAEVVARAAVERRRAATRVVVPASLLAGSQTVFVKLERRHGFFDEAGWRGLLCPSAGDARARPFAAAGAAAPAGTALLDQPWSGADGVTHTRMEFGTPEDAWLGISSALGAGRAEPLR